MYIIGLLLLAAVETASMAYQLSSKWVNMMQCIASNFVTVIMPDPQDILKGSFAVTMNCALEMPDFTAF